MISVFSSLVTLDLCDLSRLICTLEKNMCFSAFGWNVLHISIKSNWSNVLFRTSVSILVFCLNAVSIDVCGILNHPNIVAYCHLVFYVC